jgi:hypothetical protein
MKIKSYTLTPTGGEIVVSSGGKRYKKGGWGQNPMETAPLHDLCKLLQRGGLRARKLKNLDPNHEPYSLAIGGRGDVTSAEIYHADNLFFSPGEKLNVGEPARYEIQPGWRATKGGDLESLRAIPSRDLESLRAALEEAVQRRSREARV